MKSLRIYVFILVAGSLLCATPAKESYKDKSLAPQKRAELLLKEMTLEEKVGQMCQYVGPGHIKQNNQKASSQNSMGNIDANAFGLQSQEIVDKVKRGEIGAFLHVLTVDEANALQQVARQSRLKIPLLIGVDAIHGNALHAGCTVYPTAISMASTFNPELLKKSGVETASEMRASGMHWAFNPNLDVARDARWGRMGETFGEDTYLVTQMGTALIQGLQGDNGVEHDRVLACAKHLIAGGEPQGGINAAPMDLSEQKLREVYLPSFISALEKAKVFTVMPAHNELNGIPCHGNKWLLTDLLRNELGFKGFVVSDWMDIDRLFAMHHFVPSLDDAFQLSVDAGIDMHMQGPGYYESILSAVRSGRISESRIDKAVEKILEAKFLLGLFENSVVDIPATRKLIGTPEHQQTALDAARECLVLLKNDGLLPLKKDAYNHIFITGPNADSQTILGDWAMPQPESNIITVLKGIRNACPKAKIDTLCFGGVIPGMKEELVNRAAEMAKSADLNIVVIGENSMRYEDKGRTCGENFDRDNLDFPDRQEELLEKVYASGKPTVLVMLNGRALSIVWANQHVPAIVEAWEPGMKGGQAIAELLFGEINPCGKLPVSFPRSVGQIQTIYNHKWSQYSRQFALTESGPIYPFGYGLSYTSYKYGPLQLSDTLIATDGSLVASIDVTNSGKMDGTEIVQLYICDEYGSVTRPVKELKGFQRVPLKVGETKKVSFRISPDELKFFTANRRWEVEPGSFIIMVGASSDNKDLQTARLIVK